MIAYSKRIRDFRAYPEPVKGFLVLSRTHQRMQCEGFQKATAKPFGE